MSNAEQINKELLAALRMDAGAIQAELRAAGPDEVAQHPTLKDHYRVLRVALKAIAKAEKAGAK